jgi:hypothetical protein
VLPLTGRSESVLSYRLWRDVDGIAQSGQFAPTAAKRPDISTIPSFTVRLSTIKPGSRKLLSHAFDAIDVCSLLTPNGVGRKQRGNVKSARNLSQTPFCTPILRYCNSSVNRS